MLRNYVVVGIYVFALPSNVFSQNTPVAPAAAASLAAPAAPLTAQQAESASRSVRDLTLSSVIQIPSMTVQLIATKEEKSVSAGAALNWGSLTLDAKLKGPIAEGAAETTLLTLDSLSNATSLDMGVGWIEWTPSADPDVQVQVCTEHLRAAAKDLAEAKKIDPANAPLVCDRDDFSSVSYRERFLSVTDVAMRKEVCAEYARSQLREPSAIECIAAALPDVSHRERYEGSFRWGTPWQVGARGKVGYRKFKWADATTGDQQTDSEVPWEVSFGANALPGNNFVVGVEYRIIKSFKEEDKRSVCQPLQTATIATTTCNELPFGKYKDKNRHVLTGFVRRWIGIMAADLRISYDFEHTAKGFEVPLSFVSHEGKGVTVGVAAGWTSEKDAPNDGWIVRAFVGDMLKLWPGNQ